MGNKQDYETWKAIMYKRISELVDAGDIVDAVNFSLSQSLIDFPLGVYEKSAIKGNHGYKTKFRKRAGDIAKKYGLIKRAIDNYESISDKKIVSPTEKLYGVVEKRNLITKAIASGNLNYKRRFHKPDKTEYKN